MNSDPRGSLPITNPYPLRGVGYISLVYPRSDSPTDLSFTVEQSASLPVWSTASPTNIILSDDGSVKWIEARVPATTDPNMFLRLKVINTP